jgi:tetratricopeptide (TPR) repeat protein
MTKVIRISAMFLMLFITSSLFAQEINVLFKEADNFERQLKEPEALDKYKQILVQDPVNIKALMKATELSCSIGGRIIVKKDKQLNYESAMAFAKRAIAAEPGNPDANYAMAMANGKMIDVETDNKKLVAEVKDVKMFADKALSENPNHAKANFILGKWHYEMTILSGFKKAAVKVFYGGLPDASLDSAKKYLEKSLSVDPYFLLCSLTLAKVYKEDSKPAKAIEVLQRTVKLPILCADDPALKAEAQKMLQDLL